jgi:hypothetical protein
VWRRTIYHRELKASRVVRGETQAEVELRAQLQMDAWNQRWQSVQQAASKREQKQRAASAGSGKKDLALQRTREAQRELAALGRILLDGIETDHVVDWDTLKSRSPFRWPGHKQPRRTQFPHLPLPEIS